jgi:magnesium and cobalt transporter
MTPRNAIVAIEEGASRSELKSLIVTSKHSRIPVYREQLDQIVGIVYVRNLLSHLEPGQEDHPITPAINEVLTVPETKNVSELLKEMQSKAAQMTIVINEYGTVSGLVTVEDLLEEIVGDIRDEDEFGEVDLIQESAGTYVVRGGLEVEDLEKTLGLDFGEYAATTVSGLIVEQMGRVPNPGEHISKKGATFEILSADRRRILTIRVSLLQEQQTTSPDRVVDSN